MRKMIAVVVLGAAALAACGTSSNTKSASTASSSTSTTAPAVAVGARADAKLGTLLVDSRGMTLYRNSKDRPGAFACAGSCLATWPALVAPAGVTPAAMADANLPVALATVARPDGTMQVTYNGWPLYLFSGDHNAGDTSGQGIGGVWFVVAPTVAAPTASTATTAPTASTAARTATTARAVTATTAARAASTEPPSSAPATTSPPNTMATTPGY